MSLMVCWYGSALDLIRLSPFGQFQTFDTTLAIVDNDCPNETTPANLAGNRRVRPEKVAPLTRTLARCRRTCFARSAGED